MTKGKQKTTLKEQNIHRYNAKNERAKYKYRTHVKRALKRDDKTVDAALQNVREFELLNGFADFEEFDSEVADRYIDQLFDQGYSLSYINDNLRHVKEFLQWLERQKGYRSKISYNATEYLNLTQNQRKTAKATAYKKAYSLTEIIETIRKMPGKTLTEQRNKAMVSLQALCGLRVSELKSVTLNSLIEEGGHHFLFITPKEMDVKFAKSREVNFVKLPDDILQNVLSWQAFLIRQGFQKTDLLFPRITTHFTQGDLLKTEITRNAIKSGSTISAIFKRAFENAGYEHLRVHSFRHTLAREAGKHSPQYLNAVSKSLGHSSIDTTMQSYGDISPYERRNVIASETVYEDGE